MIRFSRVQPGIQILRPMRGRLLRAKLRAVEQPDMPPAQGEQVKPHLMRHRGQQGPNLEMFRYCMHLLDRPAQHVIPEQVA